MATLDFKLIFYPAPISGFSPKNIVINMAIPNLSNTFGYINDNQLSDRSEKSYLAQKKKLMIDV
jgi:hypothetical protein